MNVLREKDPLLDGPGRSTSFWCPDALREALKRDALIDGYKSSSSYMVDLLGFAIRARRAERAAQQALEHGVKK